MQAKLKGSVVYLAILDVRYAKYTTIKLKKETKELLERVLIDFESELGTRLDYDDVIRLLVTKVTQRPQLLLSLFQSPVKGHNTNEAQRLLREERQRDDRL